MGALQELFSGCILIGEFGVADILLSDTIHESGHSAFLEPPSPIANGRRLVARVVIRDGAQVWLYDPRGEPLVMLPGGGVDKDESLYDAAIREAKEETGFDVELVKYICDYSDEYSVRRYYLAKRTGGEPATRDEDGNRKVKIRLVSYDQAMGELTSAFDRAALELTRGMMQESFDPSEHPRGKTTDDSTPGSFAPKDELVQPHGATARSVVDAGKPQELREYLARREADQAYVGKATETVDIRMPNGDMVMVKDGEKDHVTFTPDEIQKLQGLALAGTPATLLHNHPSGNGGFSYDDVKFAAHVGLAEMRAVTNNAEFGLTTSVIRPKTGEEWPSLGSIQSAYSDKNHDVHSVFAVRISKGQMSLKTANALHGDTVWSDIARELGLDYFRISER